MKRSAALLPEEMRFSGPGKTAPEKYSAVRWFQDAGPDGMTAVRMHISAEIIRRRLQGPALSQLSPSIFASFAEFLNQNGHHRIFRDGRGIFQDMFKYQMRIRPRIPEAINRYELVLLRKPSIADISFLNIIVIGIFYLHLQPRSRYKNYRHPGPVLSGGTFLREKRSG